MNIVAYPGSFDIFHHWHEDIVKRAREYGKVVVAVGNNPDKKTLFTLEQRVKHIQSITKNLQNVIVTSFDWLLVHFCIQNNIKTIVKWIRDDKDRSFEKTQEFYNTHIEPSIITEYIECKPEYFHLSSSSLKEMIKSEWLLTHTSSNTLIHPLVKADVEKALMNQYFVGITWVPGTGKSFISKKFVEYASKQNIPLHYIEMDSIAKIIHDENSPYGHIRDEIAETFQEAQRTEQWWIVSKSLRPLFWTPKMDQLWAIMREAIYVELRKAVKGKQWIILLENAIFAEKSLNHLVNNEVIVATIDKKTQLERLHTRPWLSDELIKKLLRSQYSTTKKIKTLRDEVQSNNYGHIRTIRNPDLSNTREDKKIYPDDHIRKLFTKVVKQIWYTQ